MKLITQFWDVEMQLLYSHKTSFILVVVEKLEITIVDGGAQSTSNYWVSNELNVSAATSMKWIEAKLKLLGVSSNTDYKICFHLDADAMISVHTPKYGVIEVIFLLHKAGQSDIFVIDPYG